MPNLIIWYIICITLITGLTFCSVKFKFSNKIVFGIMAGVSFLSEMTKILTHMDPNYYTRADGTEKFMGYFLAPAALPFHLCSIFIFIFFYLVLSKNEENKNWILSFIVPVGIIGGVMGVAFATSGTSFTDTSAYQSFIYHAVVTWFSLHFMITKKVNLGHKIYMRNLLMMFMLTICLIWVNSILRINAKLEGRYVNFMFLAYPPMEGLPLLNLNHGWTAYFFHLLFVGFLLVSIVHSPFIIMEKLGKKKQQEIETSNTRESVE